MTSTASSATETTSGEGGSSQLELDDAYPLTALQSGMLYHSELATESATYHDIFTLTLQADYDAAALRGASNIKGARQPCLGPLFWPFRPVPGSDVLLNNNSFLRSFPGEVSHQIG